MTDRQKKVVVCWGLSIAITLAFIAIGHFGWGDPWPGFLAVTTSLITWFMVFDNA